MKVAFYRGPADGLFNRAFHAVVCWFTRSEYSHCELVIDGICWSSSNRDGGVRGKLIDLTTGKWDVLHIEGDEAAALRWFQQHNAAGYDWMGLLRFVVPFLPKWGKRWFCSEAIAAALCFDKPETFTPQDLFDALV